jgi:hypothetical protein
MGKQPKKSDRFEINGVEYEFTGKYTITFKCEESKPVPVRHDGPRLADRQCHDWVSTFGNSILNDIILTKSSGHKVMIPTVRIVDGPKGFYKLTPLGAAHLNPNKAEEN